jgi:hypothetical protein
VTPEDAFTNHVAIYGAVMGTIGTIAGIGALVLTYLAYRRDAGGLKVRLIRNMSVVGGPQYAEIFDLHAKLIEQFGDEVPPMPPDLAAMDPKKRWAYIEVVNSGRRDIHFEKACLLYEDGSTAWALESNSETLTEGRPLSVRVDEDLVAEAETKRGTRLLCAFAIDSLGRYYFADVPEDKRRLLKRFRRTIETKPSF